MSLLHHCNTFIAYSKLSYFARAKKADRKRLKRSPQSSADDLELIKSGTKPVADAVFVPHIVRPYRESVGS